MTEQQNDDVQIIRIPARDILQHERNAHAHTEDGDEATSDSLTQHGWVTAGTLSKDKVALGGNRRLRVAPEDMLDRDAIILRTDGRTPVFIETDYDADSPEARMLAVQLNDTGMHTVYKDSELTAMKEEGTDLGAIMRNDAIAHLVDVPDPLPVPEDAGADMTRGEELQEQWHTEDGQLWALPSRDGEMIHKMLIGDTGVIDDLMRLMDGIQADLIVQDPPYNVAYVGKTKDKLTIQNDALDDVEFKDMLQVWMENSKSVLKSGGAQYIFAPAGDLNFIFAGVLYGLDMYRHKLIWVKHHFVMGRCDYHYQHEDIFYGWKEGEPHYFIDDRTQSTVLHFDRPMANREHPTMKPLDLLERLITNSSKPRWLVFDGFLGSGSTLMAAENMRRYCYGVEKSPQYAAIILERYIKTFGVEPYKL